MGAGVPVPPLISRRLAGGIMEMGALGIAEALEL